MAGEILLEWQSTIPEVLVGFDAVLKDLQSRSWVEGVVELLHQSLLTFMPEDTGRLKASLGIEWLGEQEASFQALEHGLVQIFGNNAAGDGYVYPVHALALMTTDESRSHALPGPRKRVRAVDPLSTNPYTDLPMNWRDATVEQSLGAVSDRALSLIADFLGVLP